MQIHDHPQYERFVAAFRDGGFQPGETLPYHQPNCFGCGPENAEGLGLTVRAAEQGVVEAVHTFERRHEGGPGVAHGGVIAAVVDELLGRVLVREIVIAVTVELAVSYHRAIHLDEECRLRGALTSRDGRDLHMTATIEQHGSEKVSARAQFREIDRERAMNRYDRVEPPGTSR